MYVKIVDRGECFSTTMEFVDGVYANRTEWEKHNFYPQNGMVGELVKITPRAYVIKIADGIYVPMTKKGIKEITYSEYITNKNNNVCSGLDFRQKIINEGADAYMGNSWQHLPDMREHFKEDIIENMKRLTCDFELAIKLYELERSCEIYATDLILEYKRQWGSTLPPYVIDELSSQVFDVYRSLFSTQFLDESIERCRSNIHSLVSNPRAKEIIDGYYQWVNNRCSWH